MPRWEAHGRLIVSPADRVPKIMGVVNVTPDSFSDGGRLTTLDAALAHARRLARKGADLLDIGGESTRPGSDPVSVDEELRRVVPVIEAVAAELDLPLSVDTSKAEVARRAIAAGASVVNDITGLAGDPEMVRVVADSGAGVVLMHMQGLPRTMQRAPEYVDVVAEVLDVLAARIQAAEAAGIPRHRIAIDPGIGFGKTIDHNLKLLRNLGRFASLGCTLLVGTSRKRFLGTITGRPVDQRATASVVSSLAAALAGASVVRVHDVGPMADAIKVWTAVRGWEGDTGDTDR
jgi:dihydropteroate synthase